MMIVACGIPSFSASTTPDLPEALVVGLEPRQHEVELLVANRRGERLGDVVKASAVASASDSTWIARSAPRASASRITCAARAGPAEQTTTSPPCFSFRRSASSSA